MKKICIVILIISMLQLSAFVPGILVGATDDIDETDNIDDIAHLNNENNSTESVGYSTDSVLYDYTETGTPSNTYSSNIYQYDNFMESYFDNLTINHGHNTIGSCGYVGIDMLLCYYDTYLNDDIVPEQYDVPSVGSCYNMICRRNSPGSMFDMPKGYSKSYYMVDGVLDETQRNIDYYNYIEKMEETSLHAKLLSLGNSLFGINSLNLTPGLNHAGIKQVIHKYMLDVLGLTNNDEYEIYDINHSLNANKSDEVRDFVIEKIQSGVPVLLWIGTGNESDTETGTGAETQSGNGNTESHWVVAYDYDETTDKIYCNFGWGADATHATPENYVEELGKDPENNKNYYIYKSALAVKFTLPHICSDNYGVTEIVDGEIITNYYCYHSDEIEVYRDLPTLISYPSTHKIELECGDSLYFAHSYSHLNCDDEQHTSTCLICGYAVNNWHDWKCSVVDDVHLSTCRDCGVTLTSVPSLECLSLNDTSHSIGCPDCGYTTTKSHQFQYTSTSSTQHTKSCADCGYSVTGEHNFSYESVNDDYHILTCATCGATSGTRTSHSWTVMSGDSSLVGERVKCQFCGLTRLLDIGEFVPVIKDKVEDEEETE